MWVLRKLSDVLEKIAVVVAGAICLSVFLIVLGGVVFRYIGFNFALTEELSRWCLIGMCFIGASAALKQKLHIGVNMLIQRLPWPISKPLTIIAYLAVFIMLAFGTKYSFKAALAAQGMTGDIVPLSMMYIKMTLPFGMGMMFIHLLSGFVDLIKTKNVNDVLIGS